MLLEEGKIELNLKRLEELGLSPDFYTFLYLYYKGEYTQAHDLCNMNTTRLSGLERLGYIKILMELEGGFNKLQLRQKAYDLFELDNAEAKWLAFKAAYPKKDGQRMLHDQGEKCKAKYLSYIRDIGVHEQILLGLDNEQNARIEAAKKREFMPAWKSMSAWLNQKMWITYLDYVPEVRKERVRGI